MNHVNHDYLRLNVNKLWFTFMITFVIISLESMFPGRINASESSENSR